MMVRWRLLMLKLNNRKTKKIGEKIKPSTDKIKKAEDLISSSIRNS